MDSFVIEKALYKEVGATGRYQDFTKSHAWFPYQGESH
jgi:hypothetical protein